MAKSIREDTGLDSTCCRIGSWGEKVNFLHRLYDTARRKNKRLYFFVVMRLNSLSPWERVGVRA